MKTCIKIVVPVAALQQIAAVINMPLWSAGMTQTCLTLSSMLSTGRLQVNVQIKHALCFV